MMRSFHLSHRQVSVARITVKPDVLLMKTLQCYGAMFQYLLQVHLAQLATFNSNFLEQVEMFRLSFSRIKHNNSTFVSKQEEIIVPYRQLFIARLREISDRLSSNRKTGNFT